MLSERGKKPKTCLVHSSTKKGARGESIFGGREGERGERGSQNGFFALV